MKKTFLIIWFLLFIFCGKAQNLVPNWSFESTTQCPNAGGQVGFSTPWYSPTNSTPDYFNLCGTSGLSIPQNIWGYQYAKTGDAYCAICVYGSSSSAISIREYIQIELIDTLTSGEQYCVSFFVSPTGNNGFVNSFLPIMTDQIGLLLSNNPITTTNTFPLLYTPQIISPAGVFLNDTSQWMEISGSYTALGGERFITIGNFKDDAATDTLRLVDNGMDPQAIIMLMM